MDYVLKMMNLVGYGGRLGAIYCLVDGFVPTPDNTSSSVYNYSIV